MSELSWDQFYRQQVNGDQAEDSPYRRAISERDKPFKIFLNREIGRSRPVLDVGANLFSDSYLPKKDIVAVNLSFAGLSKQLKYPVNADGLALPFKDETFPVVLSRNTYGYIAEPNQLIEEMIRVLRPNGKFILIDMAGPLKQFNQDTPDFPPRLSDFLPEEIVAGLPLRDVKRTVLMSPMIRMPSGSMLLKVEAITGLK